MVWRRGVGILFSCCLVGCFTEPDPFVQTGTTTESSTTNADSTTTTTTTTTPADSSTTTGDPDTTADPDESGTTEGPPPDCVAPDGEADPSCPNPTPFCVDGSCVPCTDPAAGPCTFAVGGPICESGGRCVECTPEEPGACGGATPVCGEDNVCTVCTAHDQCPGGAGCHAFEGTCLPPDAVYEAGGADDIASALPLIGVGGAGTLRVMPGVYVENLVLPSGAVVALLADGPVELVGTDGTSTVRVLNNSTAYLAGLDIQNIQVAEGVLAAGDVRLDDCQVRLATDGVVSTGGRVHLERTRIFGNENAGVRLTGAELATLRTVIIAGNGFGASPQGLVVSGATPVSILYTTIADNAGPGGGSAIDIPRGTADVRNSILVSSNLANSITHGGGLSVSESVVADTEFTGLMGNIGIAELADLQFDGAWEISAGSVAADVASWELGDPQVDINGVMRPNMVGASDYAGADLPD